MRRSTYFRLSAVAAASLAAAAIAPGWAAAPAGARFGAPVQVTPANTGGYEPGIYTGPGNTLVMTAHKENAQLGLAPDPSSTTQTRSMSWAWVSTDGGQHWGDLPLGPADAQNHEFGDEGDMVFDDASNLYFVDTTVADVTFTSWHEADGDYQFVYNTPILGAAQAVDDRPWIAAHNNGDVFYFGNEGDKDTNYTGATNAGPGSGAGRYTVYHSTDGGKSWDHLGIQLKDSGWCRPAAGPHSNYVYALCTNDAGADDEIHNPGEAGYTKGMLYAYVSADDGKTWNRYTAGTYNARDSYTSYPSIQVARDGSLWGSYLDGVTNKTCASTCAPETAHFKVMHSTDHGKHWTTYDATPVGAKGLRFRYSWLSVANDGKSLGMAVYATKFDASGKHPAPWYVYAATFKAGQHPTLVSLDPKEPVADAGYGAPGDFLMVTHDAKGKLHVAWTRATRYLPTRDNSATALRDIFTAAQR